MQITKTYMPRYAFWDLVPKIREEMSRELSGILSGFDVLNYFVVETLKCLPVFAKRKVRTRENYFTLFYGGSHFSITLSPPIDKEGQTKGVITEEHYEPFLQALRKRWGVTFEKGVTSTDVEFKGNIDLKPFGRKHNISICVTITDVKGCRIVKMVRERVVQDVKYLVDCTE